MQNPVAIPHNRAREHGRIALSDLPRLQDIT